MVADTFDKFILGQFRQPATTLIQECSASTALAVSRLPLPAEKRALTISAPTVVSAKPSATARAFLI
jgi:hypothetical protein